MHSCTATSALVQVSSGDREASGLCREEYQAFLQHFAGPLIQQKVRERYLDPVRSQERFARDMDGTSGATMSFAEIYELHRTMLHSAFKCCKDYGTCTAKRAKQEGLWCTAKHVPRSAYALTEVPFYLSIDNASCHSFWLGTTQNVHLAEPGIPLLQLIRIPPRGHDLHQQVEHSIGVSKRHVRARIRCAHREKNPFLNLAHGSGHAQCRDILLWACEGAKLYTAQSWELNLDRLCIALCIVAGEEHVRVSFAYKGKQYEALGTAGGYCYLDFT